ncbi:MAG: HEAT repeat domain-containing protein [Kofleriaceae bacterium]
MSRLSSLLVRDGLVGVKRMEKAFQRQVIYGGALDTILLELGLVTEERLTQYLALASGVPPATRAELAGAQPQALARVPREVAAQAGVVPSVLVAEGLRVIVCEPLELARLEELADALDLGVQPVIAPEFRWQVAFAEAYGDTPPARFATLARQVDVASGAIPVGRARSVVIEAQVPAVEVPAPVLAAVPADAVTQQLTAAAPPSEEPARRIAEWDDAPRTDPGARAGTLAIVEARAQLAAASARDDVWRALLGGLRVHTRWAGLFTVAGGVATGRMAVAEPGLDVDGMVGLALTIDAVPTVRTAITRRHPHVAPLATGDAAVDAQLARLGVAAPPTALVLPLVLRDRVVAIAVAHRGEDALGLADVAELLPLAGAAVDALAAIIARTKAQAAPPPEAAASAPSSTEPAPPPAADAAPSAASSAPIDELIRAAEAGDPDALDDALARADELWPRLAARFPGELTVTRYQVAGRPLRASQHGPLLELLVQIGPPSLPLLLGKLDADDRDVRYYATAVVAELRPDAAIDALVDRLFDDDFGVRTCALEALAGYPQRELEPSLRRVRGQLHDGDDRRAEAAALAIAELGDRGAIDDLIDAVDLGGVRGTAARRALVQLTRADHSTAKRWRRWWQDHAEQHRIEWLIEALEHKEEALRQAAVDDLRRATGEDFGYRPEQARREREPVIERRRRWWSEVGRARFGDA